MLLLFKLVVPPLLVAAVSLAARLWGPTIGALLMGLPWLTGPVLFFLTLDNGAEFGVGACAGIELGVICICAYMLAYGAASAVAPWPLCLGAASAAFVGAAWAMQEMQLDLVTTASLAAICLLVTYLLLPAPVARTMPAPLPRWDIPVRMLTTLVLVAAISFFANALGAQLSGVVSTFPVTVSVVGAFTHHQWGRDAARSMLRALALSLLAFVAFFLAVGLTLPAVGLMPSYGLAAGAATLVSALVLAASRWRAAL
jgi:hypothetical protein